MDTLIRTGTFTANATILQYLNRIIYTGQLSYGHFSQRFEKEFATLHDCEFGVLSNSGTSSLLVAIQALKEYHKWNDGDEVLVPALTFVATVNVVLQSGLKPILVDVEKDYYCLNPELIRVGKKTRAIIPVHAFGQPADMMSIWDACNNLQIIEDSCEAMFVKTSDHPVGSWGSISCFSTYMAHLITTGVGGISLTSNPDYARLMRSLCNHGLAYDDLSNEGEFNPRKLHRDFVFERVGHSFRITELEAAIGLAQLETYQSMIAKRQTNARYLTDNLQSLPLQLPSIRRHTQHAFMMYPVVCLEGNRDKLTEHLNKHGIETRRMLPLISQPVYKDMWNPDDYPVAKWIDDNGFYCGIHQNLTQDNLDYMVEVMRGFYE